MAELLANLIEKRSPRSIDEYDRALREVVQEIMLLALWRAKFYEHAAFYGGTALRILYGLRRFSEDLGFSLLRIDTSFTLSPYFGAIERELAAFGLEAHVESKKEGPAIESAFVMLNTRIALIAVGASELARGSIPPNRRIKIKFEIDLDPPGDFATEAIYLLEPVPFSIKAFAASSLSAGKVHPLPARRSNNWEKGRDWCDLVFFVARGTNLDIRDLAARLRAGELRTILSLCTIYVDGLGACARLCYVVVLAEQDTVGHRVTRRKRRPSGCVIDPPREPAAFIGHRGPAYVPLGHAT